MIASPQGTPIYRGKPQLHPREATNGHLPINLGSDS